MPGFTVRLGFGLHYGWAVEGAIGSELKIDASYLSPHVSMASRLEAATKQYGTAILVSDSLFTLLSASTQQLCRLVDRVTVKGSNEPVSLYTYDAPTVQCSNGSRAIHLVIDLSISPSAWLCIPSNRLSLRSHVKLIVHSRGASLSAFSCCLPHALCALRRHLCMRIMTYHTFPKLPQVQSRGGSLSDSIDVSDQDVSNTDFFHRVAPPATSTSFRHLHQRAIQLYLGVCVCMWAFEQFVVCVCVHVSYFHIRWGRRPSKHLGSKTESRLAN